MSALNIYCGLTVTPKHLYESALSEELVKVSNGFFLNVVVI